MAERRYVIPGKYAAPLKRVAIERLARTNTIRGQGTPTPILGTSRSYVVDPVTEISAATKSMDGTVTAGSGMCWICKRDEEESSGSGSGVADEITYHLDDDGERVKIMVYNLCLKAFGGSDTSGNVNTKEQLRYLLATQDVFGDLWVSEACEEMEGSSSSSGSPPSGSSENPPSGSDKSTAIVPASWSPGGYTALFTAEMPDVRFDDVMIETIRQQDTLIEMDPKFIEVCHRDTIEVISCLPSRPVLLGANVTEEGKIFVQFAEQRGEEIKLAIRVSGTRKGFRGKRFPDRTRQQFVDNENFLNSAYKGAED